MGGKVIYAYLTLLDRRGRAFGEATHNIEIAFDWKLRAGAIESGRGLKEVCVAMWSEWKGGEQERNDKSCGPCPSDSTLTHSIGILV